MKNIFYHIIYIYIKIGLFFLVKKVSVFGKNNIPKKGAILFVSNHQNALIDPILMATTNPRDIHFLSRASAFKNSVANKLLRALNMIPIYRIRDGVNTIEKNYAIFEHCVKLLNAKKAVGIFPEGEHHLERRINPLKKGFVRIILSTLQKYPELKIQIVPVGVNYNHHIKFPWSASVYYGNPILANTYFDKEKIDLDFDSLLNDTSVALKKLTLHIEDTKNYQYILQQLEAKKIDFLNPVTANKAVKNLGSLPVKREEKRSKINWLFPLHFLAKANSIFPLLLWWYEKPKIKEAIFTNTFRFAVITTLFPLFYLLQTAVVYYFSNANYALIYLTSSVLLGVIVSKTKQL